MKRRIFSVLIALALCLSLLPVPALAEEGDPAPQADQTWDCGDSGNNVTATLSDDGTLTISGSGAMVNYESLNTLKPWNDHLASIQRIVIEDGVTSIGKFAFCKHESLTSVTIPDSVKSTEDYAFYRCTSLNSIQLPSGLTAIGSYAFMNCSALTSIDIPSGVTSIGMHAFQGSGLNKVKIPSGVTTIAEFLFAECKYLTRVEIPGSVNTIGRLVFRNAPDAEIYYAGTQQQWEAISIDGELSNKVHTSDSDLIHTVTISGGGTGASGEGEYREGAAVTVSAGTKYGYAFNGWTVGPEGVTLEGGFDPTQADTSFTMPGQAVTLTAAWEEAVADVDNVGYTTVQAAFDAAIVGGGTVYLLKDVTVDQAVTMSQGSVTLESEGKTLTGTDVYTLKVGGGTLTLENVTVKNESGSSWGINASSDTPTSPSNITIRDTATVSGSSGGIIKTYGSLTVNGKVKGTGESGVGISAMNTTLTVETSSENMAAVISGGSGANAAGISQSGGELTIKSGTISGYNGLSVEAGSGSATVHLTGGTFIGRTGNAVRVPSGFTLWDLVGVGLTLVNDDTKEIVNLLEQYTGPGTFTVSCAHYSVEPESVKASAPDENGVVTVTATCQQCKKEITLGTLTMVGSGQTITLVDEVPTFEVQVKGLTATYKWTGNFGSDTDQPQAEPAIILTDVMANPDLKFSCEVTFQTPGGGSSKVTLPFTLTVDPLDISGAEISVYPVPDNVTYDGKEHAFLTSQVGIEIAGKYILGFSDCFDIQLVDASGTPAEARTDAGTYTVQLTGKGCFKGTAALKNPFVIEQATPAIAWPEGTAEEKLTYTGEAAKLKTTPTVTVTLADGAEYDGDPVTYSYAAAEAGPYTLGLPTDAGTYYVKAAVPQQKNYTAAETAGTLKLVITKAAAEITTAPTAVNPAYNGKPQALVTAAEATFGEVQYSLTGEDGSWSKEIPTGKNAGEYTVWYKVDETDNYTGVGAQSVAAKIEKATVEAASQNLPVKNNQEKTYTLDLSPFLPVLPQGQEYGKLVYKTPAIEGANEQYIDPGTVTLAGTVLTVPVKAVNTTDMDSVALITVTIESDNFQDIRLIISVASTNQTPVTITGVKPAGWTYDGKSHPGYTGTPDTGEYTGELSATYVAWPSAEHLDGEPKDAGTYQVTLSVPLGNPDYEGEILLIFTVEPAQVTVRAEDKTAYVGEEMPEPTWRVVSGLASGETLKTDPVPACDADMSKAGTYPIAVSGGAVPDGGNYKAEIIYQPGTLTVKEKPAPPKPVDPDPGPDEPDPPVDPGQIKTKTEVEEGISQVPEGLKNIPELDSAPKLEAVMRASVTQTGIPAQNTAVYDVKLMVSNDGGQTWAPASAANFPSGGLTVTLPYPAGTDSTYQFTVVHMFTTTACGQTPGHTESPAVTNTEAGLRFTVNGLSPISVGWRAKTTGTGGSSSGGSYSGGGGSRPMASVTVEETEHGKVTSDRSSAGSGSPVTLTVQPDRGYRLESLTVADSRGNKLRLTAQGGGKYAFTMSAGAVTVKAVFAPLAEDADCPSRAFADLESGAWYHEAVDFVLRSGLMNGYGNGLFGPEGRLSRAQFAQILYNKEGRPAGAGSAPFTDVAADAWCAPAVAWAAERGIAGGYGNGTFGPDDAITREQLAVMLWRYAGSPAAPSGELSFMDAGQIGAHAREALGWAVQTGVMNGKTGGALDPKGFATRAQTAQMLKNFLENG